MSSETVAAEKQSKAFGEMKRSMFKSLFVKSQKVAVNKRRNDKGQWTSTAQGIASYCCLGKTLIGFRNCMIKKT